MRTVTSNVCRKLCFRFSKRRLDRQIQQNGTQGVINFGELAQRQTVLYFILLRHAHEISSWKLYDGRCTRIQQHFHRCWDVGRSRRISLVFYLTYFPHVKCIWAGHYIGFYCVLKLSLAASLYALNQKYSKMYVRQVCRYSTYMQDFSIRQ